MACFVNRASSINKTPDESNFTWRFLKNQTPQKYSYLICVKPEHALAPFPLTFGEGWGGASTEAFLFPLHRRLRYGRHHPAGHRQITRCSNPTGAANSTTPMATTL